MKRWLYGALMWVTTPLRLVVYYIVVVLNEVFGGFFRR